MPPIKPEIEPAEFEWNAKDERVVNDVIERISAGQSFRDIAEVYEITTVPLSRMLDRDEETRQRYTHAKQMVAHVAAQRIWQLGEDVVKYKVAPDAARVALDAYKWTASKLLPRMYGDKIEHTGNVNVSLSMALSDLSKEPIPELPALPDGVIDV